MDTIKNLVIVESPAKAKTIEKFLGGEYKVMSSYGHIRDLKRKDLSVDITGDGEDFNPVYEIPSDKVKIVKSLRDAVAKAELVWLASDEDREGEAISWHLFNVLKLKPENTRRIVFHEITREAILQAIEHPRQIDINLVYAQQARRVLDRVVGFKLSPVLWRRVKPSLSAGRVQSVAVRLLVEREREVKAFKTMASYRVIAVFSVPDANGNMQEVSAELRERIPTKAQAMELLEQCRTAGFTLEDIQSKQIVKTPAPPFTTSTLQQEAAHKYGFTVMQTMMLAQHLYESGYITYMRTDSVNLSSFCKNACRQVILEKGGEKYYKMRDFYQKAKGAQEAHEAIRPTYMENTSIEGTTPEKRLYELIWKRTIASQMADAITEKTVAQVRMDGTDRLFVINGEVVKFKGYMSVYNAFGDELDENVSVSGLPQMKIGQKMECGTVTATERFLQGPQRYNEASLVHKLEELGIGRPSTYAPTISTIQQREYVNKGDIPGKERQYNQLKLEEGRISDETLTETYGGEKSKLIPTDIGLVVNDYLTENFPDILDYNFTAQIEGEFDEIAVGEKQWKEVLSAFYGPFEESVEKAVSPGNGKHEPKPGERILGTDPKSGKPVSVKIGRYGPIVQIGSADDEEKPRFAQMKKNQSLETITLEEALDLFALPRNLGEFEGNAVTIGAGRFGPYIRFNDKYISLTGYDPLTITLEEAVELINKRREADASKVIKTFPEEPGTEILNGRYGPYVSSGGKNYRIAKNRNPQELTLEDCHAIMAEQDAKAATGTYTRRRGSKK